MSESSWGWRVHLFLLAIHAALSRPCSSLLSRFQDSDVVGLLVTLIVEGEDRGVKVIKGTDREVVFDGDEADQDRVCAIAQDILILLIQPLAQGRHGLLAVAEETSRKGIMTRGLEERALQEEVDGERGIAGAMLDEAIHLCSRRPPSERSRMLLAVLHGFATPDGSPCYARPTTAATSGSTPPPCAADPPSPPALTPPEELRDVLCGRTLEVADAVEPGRGSGCRDSMPGPPSAAAKLAAAAAATAEAAITSRLAGLRLSSSLRPQGVGTNGVGGVGVDDEGGQADDGAWVEPPPQLLLLADQDDARKASGHSRDAALKSPGGGNDAQIAATPSGTPPPSSPTTWYLSPSCQSGRSRGREG